MGKRTSPEAMKGRAERRKKSVCLWAALIIVLLLLLGILAYLLFNRVAAPEAQSPVATVAAHGLRIDPHAGALATPVPTLQEPGVAIPGWGSIIIPSGVTEAQTALQNPEANADWYYLSFELRLKATGEVLFTTGLIPPGQYCNQVSLTRALEPGEYAAIVHVQPYRISDQSPTNNADMETVLIVK